MLLRPYDFPIQQLVKAVLNLVVAIDINEKASIESIFYLLVLEYIMNNGIFDVLAVILLQI